MNKKELVSRLESLVTQYIEEFRGEAKQWEQRYYVAYQTNLKLEEQNKTLTQEKQALLDVVADWKSENQSLATLNETLSTESQNWQGQCAELRGQYSLVLKELDMSRQIAERRRTESFKESLERTEVEKQLEKAEETTKHWFRECEALKKELAEAKKELQTTQEICDREHEALKTMEVSWGKAFAAAEERYEDFKKRSDEILATMGENLQRKQEQIEALTTWKEGTEKVLDSMEEKLKDYETASKVYEETIELLTTQKGELYSQLEALKQINSFQEHRIEVLARKANKMRKKEQND